MRFILVCSYYALTMLLFPILSLCMAIEGLFLYTKSMSCVSLITEGESSAPVSLGYKVKGSGRVEVCCVACCVGA